MWEMHYLVKFKAKIAGQKFLPFPNCFNSAKCRVDCLIFFQAFRTYLDLKNQWLNFEWGIQFAAVILSSLHLASLLQMQSLWEELNLESSSGRMHIKTWTRRQMVLRFYWIFPSWCPTSVSRFMLFIPWYADALVRSLGQLILGGENYGSRPCMNIDVCSERQVQLILEVLD